MSDVADASLPRVQQEWRGVQLQVIDESNFISVADLHAISERLGNKFPLRRQPPFALLHVIMAGGTYQLAPVGGKTL